MTATDDALRAQSTAFADDIETGKFKPKGLDLEGCDFVRVGFRSWGLEASDHTWKMVLSKLDFAAREPSALLTVYAPNHANALASLDWLVFTNSIGTNGGTNWKQCVTRLVDLLGADKNDWDLRLTYLVGLARKANAGSNNGTFSISTRPARVTPPPFVFHGRIREGRTMSVFGPGSAGKTTFVDGLVVSACSGTEIVPDWVPTRPYSALLLDWDEGREEEEVRLGAICAAYDVDLAAGYHYKRQTRPLYDVADEVGAYIVDQGIEIVVVSPVGRAARNLGDNLTAPIDELYEILRSYGTTNILIDHVTGSNMKGGADREFGSVRKRDNARGSYSLYMQSEEVGTRVVVLKNTKADALAPRFDPQAVRITFDPPAGRGGVYDSISFGRAVVEDENDAPKPTMFETQPDKLARVLLRSGPMSTIELCAQTGFDARRLRDIVREARKKGYAVNYDAGNYSITKPDEPDED